MAHRSKQLFIIGGQRSGTTFLSNLLSQHKQVRFAKPIFPEPKYFIKNPNATKEEFEKAHFPNVKVGEVIAEKSTSYFENEQALSSIKTNYPKAVVVFIYRDPIERAISNYSFSKKNKLETRSLRQVFLEDMDHPEPKMAVSVNPFDYIGRSSYSVIIPKLDQLFQDQIFYIDFYRLITDYEKITQQLFERLKLDVIELSSVVERNETNALDVPEKVLIALHKALYKEQQYLASRFG